MFKIKVINKKTYNQSESESLLDGAENNGLYPKNSCRMGICNECKCKLIKGKVESFMEPYEGAEDNEILICSSFPKSDIIIDINE